MILRGEERVVVPAHPVDKVVDTTGAGDQYAAGFLLGLARGRPLAEAGALGSLAAAEVIAHWGPRPMTKLSNLAAEKGLKAALGRRLGSRQRDDELRSSALELNSDLRLQGRVPRPRMARDRSWRDQ